MTTENTFLGRLEEKKERVRQEREDNSYARDEPAVVLPDHLLAIEDDLRDFFASAQEHPLVKKYRRNALSLKFTDDDIPYVHDTKTIHVPIQFLEDYPASELKYIVAHEMAHILLLDAHYKNDSTYEEKSYEDIQWQEMRADKLAVLISGESEAAINAYKKGVEDFIETVRLQYPETTEFSYDELVDILKEKKHPSILDALGRIDSVEKAGERLATPESELEFMEELDAELSAAHKEIFPAQFARKIDNTREEGKGLGELNR